MLDSRLQHAHQAAHDAEMSASVQAIAPALVSLAVALRLVIEFLGTRDLPEHPPAPQPFRQGMTLGAGESAMLTSMPDRPPRPVVDPRD
jgi:hypothetical protein